MLRSGYLEQCDTPQVLYDRPGTMFVAAFMGSPAMNLYRADVAPGLESVKIGDQEVKLSDQARANHPGLAAYAGKQVVIGLRAEHLQPYDGSADAPTLSTSIELVEALGSELLIHLRLRAHAVRPEGLSSTDVGARLSGQPGDGGGCGSGGSPPCRAGRGRGKILGGCRPDAVLRPGDWRVHLGLSSEKPGCDD